VLIFPVLSLCFASGFALAQSPPLSVEEAVSLAIKNNPRVSASVQDITAARLGVRSAKALVNPTFYIAPSVPNANGAPDALLFSQPLELNGTRSARTGVASAQLRVTQARSLTELRGVVFEVKSAYYELARARELLSLSQDLLKTSEEFDRIARRQVELGRRPGIDLAQTGIEVARALQQVSLAESRVLTSSIALNTLLNRNSEEPIGTLAAFSAPSNPGDKETLILQALLSRAEITLEDALRDSFLQTSRLAKAEGRPDLVPQFRSNEIVRSFSPRDYGFSVAVTLPLFDWGSRRNRIRQAEGSASAQADRLTATRHGVRQEVEQSLVRVRTAETLLNSYQQGILDRAKRLLDAAKIGLQEGAAGTTLLTVLEAQRIYRTVQTDYANAQADYTLFLAELERALGTVPVSLFPQIITETRRSK